jgi:hypothetical protein
MDTESVTVKHTESVTLNRHWIRNLKLKVTDSVSALMLLIQCMFYGYWFSVCVKVTDCNLKLETESVALKQTLNQ